LFKFHIGSICFIITIYKRPMGIFINPRGVSSLGYFSYFWFCIGMTNPLFKPLSPIIPLFAIFCNALVMASSFFLSDPP
jgi:hypothetical protein